MVQLSDGELRYNVYIVVEDKWDENMQDGVCSRWINYLEKNRRFSNKTGIRAWFWIMTKPLLLYGILFRI